MTIPELTIEKVVYQGYGLGFYNSKPVFVLNALPGDDLEIEVTSERKGAYFGRINKIIRSSPLRIETACPVFGICGGCDWLNVSYQDQLTLKNGIIKEIFATVPELEIAQIISSEQPYHYRNKVFLPVGMIDNEPNCGLFARGSHQIVQHNWCALQPAVFIEIKKIFSAYIRASRETVYDENSGKGNIRYFGMRINSSQDQILITVVTTKRKLAFTRQLTRMLIENHPQIRGIIQNINSGRGNRILGDEQKILYGQDAINESLLGKNLSFSSQSFFQVNHIIAEKLFAFIRKEVDSDASVLDAYSGVGTAGISIADKVKRVYLIENNVYAVRDSIENCKQNDLTNIQVIKGDVEQQLPMLDDLKSLDTIIFDPPRKGLDSSLINAIERSTVRKILYISCNPATLLRDLTRFQSVGFKAVKLQPFDMFPHTFHIENVLILKKT